MKTNSGFEQCYNSQAAVDHDSYLIVGQSLSNHPNDQKELLVTADSIPAKVGKPKAGCADAGYASDDNIDGLIDRGIDPYIATGRDSHHDFLDKLSEVEPIVEDPKEKVSKIEKMRQKLSSKAGKEIYRFRKMTVEPVFGIIKQAMRFRQFSFKGQKKVSNEWGLVCLSYNLRRLFKLGMSI